jgi:hypothetical protein
MQGVDPLSKYKGWVPDPGRTMVSPTRAVMLKTPLAALVKPVHLYSKLGPPEAMVSV